jgi:hypothetical protein
MVREILGYNPRRIKVFLNQYRLWLYVASSQGLLDFDRGTGKAEVTPEQLGKFLAVTVCYPDVLKASLGDETFFQEIEEYIGFGESSRKEYFDAWLSKPGLRNLLAPERVLTRDWVRTYSLREFPVKKFVRILPPVPAPSRKGAEMRGRTEPADSGFQRGIALLTDAFVLSQDDNFNWQGKAGDTVTVKVVSKDTTIPITLADVFYPKDTAVPFIGDTVKFKIVADPNDLSLSIKPRTVPPITWSAVEVGTDGTTQVLDTVNDGVTSQDPYSTSVTIIRRSS